MHTLRHASAEAVTADGVHWDIYVSNDELLTGIDLTRHVTISEIRFGNWSAHTGLKRGRLSPSEDFRRMEAIGNRLYEHLTRTHLQVPFAFRDQL